MLVDQGRTVATSVQQWMVVAAAFLLFLPMAAGTWTVYKGDTFKLDDANATLEWGQNYTWNATGFTTYSDTLFLNMTGSLQDRNITLSSNTTAEFNTTLWRYNLSQPAHKQAAVKISGNATSGTTVTFEFTALPQITFGHYVLSGGQSKTYTYGHDGTITWSNSDWSAENFTLTYENDTTAPSTALSLTDRSIPTYLSTTISCSASDPAGIRSTTLTVEDPTGDTTAPTCGTEFDPEISGSHTVTFTATDQAGNTNTRSTTLTVTRSGGGGGPTPPPSAGHSWLLANNTTRFT
ncbi:MAG: hypothetical protein ABEI97_01125, partial [Candidatus Nanohaloarchaea archaeon]